MNDAKVVGKRAGTDLQKKTVATNNKLRRSATGVPKKIVATSNDY